MKKHFLYSLLAIFVVMSVILPVCASNSLLLVDEPDLLTSSEESLLISRLEEIGTREQIEIVIAVLDTIDGSSPMAYADDFYDYNGYGYGDNRDGLILLIAMDTRDWWISTSGRAISIFTDAGIDYIGDQIVPFLSAGDYYTAFDEFADVCEDFITQASTGDAFDYHNLPKSPFDAGTALIIAFVLGLIIAIIYTNMLKSQLKTVKQQPTADMYLKKDSLQVTDSRDIFLYRNVIRTPKENSSSRGGSSSHRSSSGRSHGGGGGKF